MQAIEAHGTLAWLDVRLASAPPPVLRIPRVSPNGSFQFRLEGTPERSYAVELSLDLASWAAWETNPAGAFDFTDTNIAPPRQRGSITRVRLLDFHRHVRSGAWQVKLIQVGRVSIPLRF